MGYEKWTELVHFFFENTGNRRGRKVPRSQLKLCGTLRPLRLIVLTRIKAAQSTPVPHSTKAMLYYRTLRCLVRHNQEGIDVC